MKTRKGEPVIVVPEWQQQIVELERELAEANTRIETLTRRLEAANERAEAWEEAALGKTGKLEFDEMERSWRETVVRAEEVEAERDELRKRYMTLRSDLRKVRAERDNLRDTCIAYEAKIDGLAAERDELKRQLAAERKEHLETREKLKKAEAELRRWRGCPSCKEDHDDSVMCPPHEVRTSGRAWFHTQARKWAERAEQLQVERDELQRKLDACQCETRVLNESLLIEAKQERDQLAAECVILRDALERLEGYHTAYVIGYHIAMNKPVKRLEDIEWHEAELQAREALAATPHAAKAVERVKAMETALRAAHHELTTLHGLWACDNFDVYDGALADGCDHNAAWERFCDEMWQIDTAKPIEQIDNALATTPHATKAAERVRKLENAVQAGRDYRDWNEVGCPDVGHDVLTPEQHFEFALDVLDALNKPEVQEWKCPNPNCINGAEDTGGVTPWDEPILIPCPACQDRKRNAAAHIERVTAMEDVFKIARKAISHITHVGFLSATDWEKLEQLRAALDRLDATGATEGDSDATQR